MSEEGTVFSGFSRGGGGKAKEGVTSHLPSWHGERAKAHIVGESLHLEDDGFKLPVRGEGRPHG